MLIMIYHHHLILLSMKKVILFFCCATIVLSCGNEKKDSTLNLEEGTVKVNYMEIEPSDRILEYANISIIDKFKVKFNSDKARYSHFIAFYSLDHNNLSLAKNDWVSLKDFMVFEKGIFNGSKVHNQEPGYVIGEFDYLLRSFRTPNDILKNDSVYFGIVKHGLYTSPVIGDFFLDQENELNGEHLFKDNEIIPLFITDYHPKEPKNKVFEFVIMGLILSEDVNIDFENLLKAPSSKSLIYKPLDIDYDKLNFNNKVPIDSYILKSYTKMN